LPIKIVVQSDIFFIESSIFTRRFLELASDYDLANLQEMLRLNPETGDLIRGSGGLRKIRIALEGKGKSGGARAIYYYTTQDGCIFLLYIYAKNEQENLTPDQLKRLRQLMEA
jgi:hypothetical protein